MNSFHKTAIIFTLFFYFTSTAKAIVEDVTEACLQLHNKYRIAGMTNPLPAFHYSAEASNFAAQFMAMRESQGCATFAHSPNRKGLGENLYGISGGRKPTCKEAVKVWYDEIKNFGGSYPGTNWTNNISRVGHFTQLMWNKSVGLGCALTTSCRGFNQLVCNYTPAGNFFGVAPFSKEEWNSMLKRDRALGSLKQSPFEKTFTTSRYPVTEAKVPLTDNEVDSTDIYEFDLNESNTEM